MIDSEKLEILNKGALELGIGLDEGQGGAFLAYLRELKTWNKRINLTSIEDDREILIKHFLDSLTPARFLSGIKSVLDMGAGAGFPGIPLKIAMPDLQVTLLDSVLKKVSFMRHVIRTLGLNGIEAIHARAEANELKTRLAGSFDCVISRAFSELTAFSALALPYLKPNGMLLGMKGPAVIDELEAIGEIRGFSRPEVHEARIPFSNRVTRLVIMRKL
ncbi:MAG: 16S rRNA (guanine(527)-N(7))-methyltransferase RsmG [Thermodesulfobacteriota bacterium]|nr:MAG: 16S rRNA (guanine(527)-N(7))-methyltransferase RsmG [Thermodesulfobacteriota bacterium]